MPSTQSEPAPNKHHPLLVATTTDKNRRMWESLPRIFDKLSHDSNVRCIVLSSHCDKAFTAGLDVQSASASGPTSPEQGTDTARAAWKIRRHIFEYQDAVSSLERCEKRTLSLFLFEVLLRFKLRADDTLASSCYCTVTRHIIRSCDRHCHSSRYTILHK